MIPSTPERSSMTAGLPCSCCGFTLDKRGDEPGTSLAAVAAVSPANDIDSGLEEKILYSCGCTSTRWCQRGFLTSFTGRTFSTLARANSTVPRVGDVHLIRTPPYHTLPDRTRLGWTHRGRTLLQCTPPESYLDVSGSYSDSSALDFTGSYFFSLDSFSAPTLVNNPSQTSGSICRTLWCSWLRFSSLV